jgi:hypothetical protein
MRVRLLASLILAAPLAVSQTGPGPRTAGAPAIARTRDGKPDLSGIWQVMN